MSALRLLPHAPTRPALLAEFTRVEPMLAALDALRRESYHDVETFTPYDVPDVDRRLGYGVTSLGKVSALGGLCGLLAAYGIQWWANVHSYPLNSGGRPAHAAPAFILATFEGMIAGAAVTAFVALFVLLRYPRPWSPEDEVDGFERATIDRFWIGMPVFASEHDREHAATILQRSGAVRTVKLGET
jgi:hypothetical protein